MPDTVSIIRAEGKPLSVEAERKQHSDWVKQEAQILMDELFSDLNALPPVRHQAHGGAVDVEWVEGLVVNSSLSLDQSWADLDTDNDEAPWVTQAESTPFYRRLLLILGGLAIVTPLSFWGATVLKEASQPRSVVAAMPEQPLAANTKVSDQEFATYAEQALRQIKAEPQQTSAGITSLPTLKIGDRPSVLPPNLPPIAPTVTANPSNPVAVQAPAQASLPAPSAPAAKPGSDQAQQSNKPAAKTTTQTSKASQAELDRLALRVFKPNKTVKSEVPSVSASGPSSATVVPSSGQPLPAPPNTITTAPSSDLPTLATNVAGPTTVAAATPMNSPENASKKVIGIVELGLQSTLMVSNNGSHLNFQVGDTVNDDGWQLIQIAQGKAILQKGTEYKTLSEGQYF